MNKVERSEAHTDREGRTLNSLIAVVVVFSACALAAPAQTLPTYTIYRTYSPITIDGKMTDRAWRNAPVATEFHFNWWTAGEKEPTDVRMLWDDQYLYVAYYCHDKHIYADVTEHQGPVSKDDAIEFYASPNPNKLDFDGFEINALGTWLAFRIISGKEELRWEPQGLQIRTSFSGQQLKEYSPNDDHWTLELAIPWGAFSNLAAHTPPRDGDRWRVNLNRIDRTDDEHQYSTWSPVNTPKPRFAVPEDFGYVQFANRKPPKNSGKKAPQN
jgi:hypothetical protein